MTSEQCKPGPWSRELDHLLRSISSAFLFGVALLYTMEVWWLGMTVEYWKLFLFLLVAVGVNFFVGHFSGLSQEKGCWSVFFRAVQSFVIGLVSAFVCLVVLNRITFEDPVASVIGKTLMMVIPFSIGAFLSDIVIPFLGKRTEEEEADPDAHPWKETLADIGATIAGGIFIGLPIAPTEEVSKLAVELGFWNELALIGLTLLVTYLIVFACFPNREESLDRQSIPFLQRPMVETGFSYTVSLLLALALLFFFDQIESDEPVRFILSEVITLGFPIAIGGAAGRLAV